MKLQTLKKNLKRLKDISPSKDWQSRTRGLLLEKISSESQSIVPFSWSFSKFYSFVFSFRSLRVAVLKTGIFSLVAGMIFGGGIASSLAEVSLPGEPLYSFKLAVEQTRLALAGTEDTKIKVQTSIAENRLNELQQIVRRTDDAETVKTVVQSFTQEVSAVGDHLEKVKSAPADDAAFAALEVTSKIKELSNTLKQTEGKLPKSANKELKIAFAAIGSTENKALEVLVEKHQDTDKVSEDQVSDLIKDKITNTETAAPCEPAHAVSRTRDFSKPLQQGETFSSTEMVEPDPTLCAAKDKLDEAKKNLQSKDLEKAVEKTTEADKILQDGVENNKGHQESDPPKN